MKETPLYLFVGFLEGGKTKFINETIAGGQSEILSQAQEAIYDRQTEILSAHSYKDAEHAVPWIKNELLFENEPLADIAVTLERMYNVTIVFENDIIKARKCSA